MWFMPLLYPHKSSKIRRSIRWMQKSGGRDQNAAGWRTLSCGVRRSPLGGHGCTPGGAIWLPGPWLGSALEQDFKLQNRGKKGKCQGKWQGNSSHSSATWEVPCFGWNSMIPTSATRWLVHQSPGYVRNSLQNPSTCITPGRPMCFVHLHQLPEVISQHSYNLQQWPFQSLKVDWVHCLHTTM